MDTKKFGNPLITFMFVWIAVSCGSSKPDDEPVPRLSVDPATLNYESIARKGSVAIQSNGRWNVASDVPWITFALDKGSGNGNLAVDVAANTETASRTGTITVSQEGVQPQKTVITQLGASPEILISATAGNAPAEGGEITFTVTSNVEWIVEIPAADRSWISVVQNGTKAMTSQTARLKIERNSGSARTSAVRIQSPDGKVSKNYQVTQSASESGELSLTQDEFAVPAGDCSLGVPLFSTLEYEVATTAGWIVPDKNSSTLQMLRLTLSRNNSDELRTAEVIVRHAGGGQQAAFTVTQYGSPDVRIGDDVSVGALAFPGAEGGGRMTTGGRGGKVYAVTSLEDTNTPGTLRYAVNQSGKRTVVFAVSGTIRLGSNMRIKNGDITIAGQTAPGDGICLRGYQLEVDADNVIIRFIRARLGDDYSVEADAFGGRYATNVIIDHCSASWSVDECVSFYANTNFTLQWCISSESLRNASHEKGAHGYGGIWGGKNASYHHNILAHHDSRNPRIQGVSGTTNGGVSHMGTIDLRNNVIYNWAGNSAYGGEEQQVNFINCYYKPGPATSKKERIYSPDASTKEGSSDKDLDAFGRYYIDGNYVYGSPQATADNWAYGVWNQLHSSYNGISQAQKLAMRIDAPHPFCAVTTHGAEEAYERVLAHAGASLRRDAVDRRVINDISTGTAAHKGSVSGTSGIIDKVSDVGGYPELKSLPAPADTDLDGIPDIWEDSYGLDRNNPADGSLSTLDPMNRYTNLEVYLHNLVQDIVKKQNAGGIRLSSQ